MATLKALQCTPATLLNKPQEYYIPVKLIYKCKLASTLLVKGIKTYRLTYGRFLERKIWNPLVYVADRLKKLRAPDSSISSMLK